VARQLGKSQVASTEESGRRERRGQFWQDAVALGRGQRLL